MTSADIIARYVGLDVSNYIGQKVNLHHGEVEVQMTNEVFNIDRLKDHHFDTLINLQRINDIRDINSFLQCANSKLKDNGIFVGCVETKLLRRKRLFRKFPPVIGQIYFGFDFIFKRVFPKLFFTRWFYMLLTAGRNQVLSKTESLGRFVYNGFRILDVEEVNNMLYFTGKKVSEGPIKRKPNLGPFFRMKRMGAKGKEIFVYKIRTMHPYAEFLQDYVYETNSLEKGGKFKNDFRVTTWGKVLRKLWIDEIPMILNFLKGEIKLVGVRPLSSHYLSLYTDSHKRKRSLVKPGLVPPYYADMPDTLPEIMESEARYIREYKESPFKTDLSYFIKATTNILFRNARSS